jgi:cytochrome c7-like protein
MPQVFSKAGTLAVKLASIAIAIALLCVVAVAEWAMSGSVDVSARPAQPIPFSHKHHAGDDAIDCRYCHAAVEKAAFAGMPSTRVCLTCHSQLFRDAPVLAPLHKSAQTGSPIAWTRVYKLPGFVYFDHSVHVNHGVGCIECHGRVDEMPITRRETPLTMEWCLDCHRNPEPRLRPREHVFAMVETRSVRASDTPDLMRAYRIESTRRLIDCSTCHR